MKQLIRLAAIAIVGSVALAAPSFAALKVGTTAPDFSAPAYLAGKAFTFNLADALKKGPVVVYFFPAAHTSGCNLEAHLFSQAIEKFKAQDATVIGVTAGNVDELADFSKETEHCGGKFAVAADPGAKIAKQYDAILSMKPEWSDRTSYVIAPSGSIVHVYSALNPSKHVDETLDAVKALRKKPAPRPPHPSRDFIAGNAGRAQARFAQVRRNAVSATNCIAGARCGQCAGLPHPRFHA